MIKKYFFTGLLMLLPFAMTLYLATFLINLWTDPFQGAVESILNYFGLFNRSFLIFPKEQVLFHSSKLISVISLFLFILLIGFLARLVFMDYFLNLIDSFLRHIPIVNKIYKTLQEIIQTFFTSSGPNFSQVVLAPFPHENSLSIGLIPSSYQLIETEDIVPVFIPGAPNPTGGFLLKFKRQELIFTDVKVEDALKFVTSVGILLPKSFLT